MWTLTPPCTHTSRRSLLFITIVVGWFCRLLFLHSRPTMFNRRQSAALHNYWRDDDDAIKIWWWLLHFLFAKYFSQSILRNKFAILLRIGVAFFFAELFWTLHLSVAIHFVSRCSEFSRRYSVCNVNLYEFQSGTPAAPLRKLKL